MFLIGYRPFLLDHMPCCGQGHGVSCHDPNYCSIQWESDETAARVECNMADATLICGLDNRVGEQTHERLPRELSYSSRHISPSVHGKQSDESTQEML